MKVALIGHGRWGKNIAQTLSGFPEVDLEIVERGADASGTVDAVIIATPSATHAEIALFYIKRGVPTFIEKPLAISLADAIKIRDEAHKRKVFVFVGHLYLFNPAFKAFINHLHEIGDIRYVSSEKTNNVTRSDVSVLWDWLPHDIAMGMKVFQSKPRCVRAWTLASDAITKHITAAEVQFQYPDETSFVSRISSITEDKQRRTTITGARATIIFDDIVKHKIRLMRDGAETILPYMPISSLTMELRVFLTSISTKKYDSEQLDLGVDVVRCIEAAHQSASSGGKAVSIIY